MKLRSAVYFALAAGLICMPMAGFARQDAPAGAQPAANSAPGASNSSQAGAVSLDVYVADKSGAPVTGLQASDFKLTLDKKQQQNIVSVRALASAGTADDPPAVAVLVLDNVCGSILTVSQERQMLDKYFDENGQLPIPIYLVILTDQGMKIHTPATQDGKVLKDFLDANTNDLHNLLRPDGWTGEMERAQVSWKTLDYITSQVGPMPGRKLFIWLSPGWNLQTNGQWDGASKSDEQQLYDHAAKELTALRTGRVTLYQIDPWGPDHEMKFAPIYEAFVKGLENPKHADYGYLLLQILAIQSGGQALYLSNNMSSLITKCLDESKSYYTLTFNPPAGDHPTEYHSVEVQVDKPGAKARTRTVYYSNPAAAAAK